jgi:hypothetical protein
MIYTKPDYTLTIILDTNVSVEFAVIYNSGRVDKRKFEGLNAKFGDCLCAMSEYVIALVS